jgi:hypothetical protein
MTTTLTSQTTFTVQDPLQELTDQVDLVLLPENTGVNAMRELHYPGDVLPPIIYEEPPDSWENFDSGPLTARPLFKAQMTLEATQLTAWPGYLKDQPVSEIWKGSDTVSRMPVHFLRRLLEYFLNPPASGYITWWPKDRTATGYNIVIANVQAGNATSGSGAASQGVIALDNVALQSGYVMGVVTFSFYIVGESS